MLRIEKADYDLIRWEAERRYPKESCGIILGTLVEGERTVTMTVPCENKPRDSQGNRYHIDPGQLVAALKLARSRSETIIGFYHSQPDHPTNYSTTDLADAHWFGCSYVITSVERGHAATTDSYMLMGPEEQKKFQREEIEVIGNTAMLRIAL